MSSLDKLAIRGIRSFDNNKSSVVDFQSPVTVIVGSNGTGKTTVIECLKYCTTGELPPNTKGGAFVHDPKLAGENEVKAQVKLRFQNSNGERMVVTRNLQVTSKKTGLSMKTLEGVLAKDENEGGNHKRNTISTKCSEIDSEVPRLLGVSKAILDNVIFCHQEESNWPLSEPAPLKKKFDEIFEATRFTDALDSIKKIRKENMAELKVEKEKLNHLRLEKDRSETIKVKLAKIETQIANQQQTADDTGDRANDLAKVNVEFREKAGEFMAIFDKVKNLEHEISVWEEQIASYEDSMTLLKDSEDELRVKVQSFGRTLEEKKRRSQETQNKKSDEMEGLRALERELSGMVQSRGQVLGEKKMHETAIKEREEIAQVLCATYQLKGYDYSPLEKVKIDEILDKLKDVKKKHDNLIRQMKIDSKAAEEAIRAKLNALTAAKATEVGERSGLQKQLTELDRLVRNDTQESQDYSVGTNEAEIHLAEQKIEETKRSLAGTETKIADSKFEEAKRTLKVEIAAKESEREALNAEFSSLNQNSETRATLNVKREGVKGKEDFIETHLEQQTEPHRRLVGTDPLPATMEQTVTRALTDKESEITTAEKKKSVADRKLTSVEALVTSDKDKIREKQNEIKGIESRIKRVLAENDFDGSLAAAILESKDQIKGLTEDMEQAAIAPGLFRSIKKQIGKRHACLGCNRKIEEGTEEAEVNRYIERQLKELERKLEHDDSKEHLDRWEDVLASLHRLQPEQERADSVKSTVIPDLNAALATKQSDLVQAKTEAERAVETLDTLKSEQRDLLNLKGVAVTITRAHRDLQSLAQDVVYLENQLAASGSMRTAKDVEVELVQIAEKTSSRSPSSFKLSFPFSSPQMAPTTNAVASSSKRAARSDSHVSHDSIDPSESGSAPSSSKKPRLTPQDSSNTNSHLSKFEKYHYSDGNLVLHIQSKEFKVHRSLFERSPVFKDLLLVGNGNGQHSSIDRDEDVVVIKLEDELTPWRWALKAIYDGFNFRADPPEGEDLMALMVLCEKYSFDWIFSYCQTIFHGNQAYITDIDFNRAASVYLPDPAVPENDVLDFTYRIASRFPQEAKILPKLFYIMARSSNDLGKLAKSETSPNGLGLEDVLRVHRILQTGLSLQRDMETNFKPSDLVYHLATSGCRGAVAPSCRAAATKHWETEWKPLFGSSQLRCRGLLLAPRPERWIASGVREPCVKAMMEEWKKRLKEFDATL